MSNLQGGLGQDTEEEVEQGRVADLLAKALDVLVAVGGLADEAKEALEDRVHLWQLNWLTTLRHALDDDALEATHGLDGHLQQVLLLHGLQQAPQALQDPPTRHLQVLLTVTVAGRQEEEAHTV